MKNDSALFFTCSLIEYIGRKQKLKRAAVVGHIGKEVLKRIYKFADEFIAQCSIPEGSFDNVAKCRYEAPDYWVIGEVYERLVEDTVEDDIDNIVGHVVEIYSSWIDDVISNYNTDFYYQSREYIYECYKEGRICA